MSDQGPSATGGGGRDPDDEKETPRPAAEGVRIIGAEEAAAALETGQVGTRRPDDAPRFGDRPQSMRAPRPRRRFSAGVAAGDDQVEDATAVTPPPSAPEMPHWTEPPTGEVPRILAGDEGDAAEDTEDGWQNFTARAPRWRDQQTDWDEGGFEDVAALGDESRVGALDDSRTPHSDLYSFEEDPLPTPPPVAPPPAGRARGPQPRPQPPRRPAPGGPVAGARPAGGPVAPGMIPERNMATAVMTGVGIAVLALIVFRAGPGPTLALAVPIVTLCAVEIYDSLRRAGYRPATLLGLTATVSIMVATYSKGETAIPLVFSLTIVCSMLWFLFGVMRARPTVNIAATLLGFTWTGFLGCFAGLLLRLPHGISYLLGAVLATVAYDVGGYFIGSRSGRTPLAPAISPNKTWEGLIGGAVAAILVSVVVTRAVFPWTIGSSAALGVLVAVVAPLGDLCESMIKRDLGMKDMGTILPGHGGVLDRFDALLFVLPATYYLVHLLALG